MADVFKNPLFNKQFAQSGYLQLPLLNKNDIDRLLALVERYKSQYQQVFHTTHFSIDEEYKKQVNDLIIEIVSPKLTVFINNYRPVFGNLMIKQSGDNYFMPLHADWTYVDEHANCRSIAVWIPLIDTNETNGCLGVIAGSHKVTNKIRGPRIQTSSYNNDKEWVKQAGELLPVKAGSAVIYDHALLHYSPANKSSLPRPALNLSLVPEGAEVIHYCIPEGADEIEVYRADDSSFYIQYSNYQRPKTNSLLKTLPANTVEWIDSRMENLIKQNKKGKNFFSRLFGV